MIAVSVFLFSASAVHYSKKSTANILCLLLLLFTSSMIERVGLF